MALSLLGHSASSAFSASFASGALAWPRQPNSAPSMACRCLNAAIKIDKSLFPCLEEQVRSQQSDVWDQQIETDLDTFTASHPHFHWETRLTNKSLTTSCGAHQFRRESGSKSSKGGKATNLQPAPTQNFIRDRSRRLQQQRHGTFADWLIPRKGPDLNCDTAPPARPSNTFAVQVDKSS
jgi:hypothetical protein